MTLIWMKPHWDLCIIDSFYESCCLTLVYSAYKVMLNVREKSHERGPLHPHLKKTSVFFHSLLGYAVLLVSLIEIQAQCSKLSKISEWQMALCNYVNHCFRRSGAVRNTHEVLWTYWQGMSGTERCVNVPEMSLVEQNALVDSWYLQQQLYSKESLIN